MLGGIVGTSGSATSADPRRRDRLSFLVVFVLALALRVGATLQYEARHPNAAHPAIDEASYDAWARRIADGEWVGREVFFQEPLYPYALGTVYAVLGPSRLAARLVQCALWAATAVLVGLLARRMFGRVAGLLAAILIAGYGPGLIFPSLLLKENLFLPLFALLALAIVRTREAPEAPLDARTAGRRWLVVGVIAGLGALLRGNVLVLIPAFALWPLARAGFRRGIASSARVLAGAACVLLPVALRNLAVGGDFLLTTSGAGTNLYGGNNLENPYGRASEFSFLRGIPEHEAGDWRREAERRAGRALGPSDVSAFWRDEALRSAREHPRAHVAILWNKLRLTLGRYEVPDNHFLPWDARYVPLARAPWPGFGFVGMLGIAGLALVVLHAKGKRGAGLASLPSPGFALPDRGAALDVAALFVLYLGTVVLTVTSDRARLPLVVPLACFAAWALAWIGRAVATRNPDAIVRLAFALFCGALVVHTPVLPPGEAAADHDERDFNLAAQWVRSGEREDEARAIAARLVLAHPRSARSRLLLAEIDFRAGGAELDLVLAAVEPLADDPGLVARERFRARSLAAWIQLARGASGAAEDRFRQALLFDGESRELRLGLARALVGGAGAPPAAASRARAEEALAILSVLRAQPQGKNDVAELEILSAQAEFARGRAILAGPPKDDEERELGQESVRAALKRLRPVATSRDAPASQRVRARLAAGEINLWLRDFEAAENHYRAALDLGAGREAQLGLVHALVGSLEDAPRRDDHSKRIEEAEGLLAVLRSYELDPSAIVELAQRLANAR